LMIKKLRSLTEGSLLPIAFNRDLRRIAHDEKVAEVLRIYLSVRTDGHRRVSRAYRELQKSLLLERAALIDRKDVTVLAVGVSNAVAIYAECIHAPLEAVWMIINASDRAVRLASATERVCVLELPFYPEIGIELSDEVLLRIVRRCGRAIRRANFGIIAVRANRVMVVFGDDRVCSLVAENCRSDIPAEQVGREELACRTEPHQMPLRVVIPGVSAEYD